MHCSKMAFVFSVSLTVGNGQRTEAIYHLVVEIDLSKKGYELCASFRNKMIGDVPGVLENLLNKQQVVSVTTGNLWQGKK